MIIHLSMLQQLCTSGVLHAAAVLICCMCLFHIDALVLLSHQGTFSLAEAGTSTFLDTDSCSISHNAQLLLYLRVALHAIRKTRKTESVQPLQHCAAQWKRHGM